MDSDQSTDEEAQNQDRDEFSSSPPTKHGRSSESPRKLEESPIRPSNNTNPAAGLPPNSPFPPTSLSNFLGYGGAPSPYLFLQQNPLTSIYAGMMFGGASAATGFPHGGVLTSPQHLGNASLLNSSGDSPRLSTEAPLIDPAVLSGKLAGFKRPACSSPGSPCSPTDGSKKSRMQMRILKDEPVPEGYIRFRFNEDCNYPHCGYREHQTHFHCTREDCGYSFCDKTRFVQHTARHERLDTLMGGDFKQFRANIACGRGNCTYIPNSGEKL